MKLYDELYFEITAEGTKGELKKLVKFLKSGELDDFFEITSDYIAYDDEYPTVGDEAQTSIIFTNDDIGIDISSFEPEAFLDVFCKSTKNLYVSGHFYDINDDEYEFESPVGSIDYNDRRAAVRFNDELDNAAYEESRAED